ncbi:MAG: peptidylprolyl isomerase [Thermoguttaceae bacterium]|nr:peptidylprolyl isomerase [Thermoguttaceae bacterium]
MKKTLFAALLATTFGVGAAFAQEAAPAAAPQAAAVADRIDGPQYEKFSVEMTKYKDNLKKLRSLKDAYQTASDEGKDKIVAEFEPLLAATTKLQKNLVPLALDAYKSVDGQSAELRAFLCGMLQWAAAARENYETAYDIAKVVFEYPLPENSDALYAYAAYAAFCSTNLEDAKKWRDFINEKDKNVWRQADPEGRMNMERMLFDVLPDYEAEWAKEKEIRAKEAADNLPRVLIKTTKGDIVLELFKNEAPNAVGNFLTLVSEGKYSDVPFHRVLPFFMAQGGDVQYGNGTGGPGYCIPCECRRPNARAHFRGSISMAHAGPNTGGSQFFLTFVPTSFLNGVHTVFGRVVEGMDVLSEIERIDPEAESNVAPDKIIEAKILRGEPFEFEKLPERGF